MITKPPMIGRVELITPEQASKLLERNCANRNIRRNRVEAYVQDRKAGKWRLTHQGIAISEEGNLIDGQHRLTMIVESGMPTHMFVVYNVPVEAFAHIDGMMVRKGPDALKLAGLGDYTNKYIAAVNAMHIFPQEQSSAYVSKEVLVERIVEHNEAIDFAYSHLDFPNVTRGIRALVAKAFYHADATRLVEWCQILKTGMTISEKSSEDSAAIVFRNYAMKITGHTGGSIERERYCKAQTALRAFLDRQPMTKVYGTIADLFPLPK